MNLMTMSAKLGLDKSGFDKGLASAKSSASSSGNSITTAFKKIGTAAAAAFSVAKITQFSKACVDAANTQITAETKLATVMKQRMGSTEASISSMEKYASALQETGVVGDETAMSGMQQLSTFLKSEQALKTLTPAMENLAVQQNGVNVTGEQMKSIGNMMGKVMQGSTSALTRVGISFSSAEEAALKYGTEEERAATLAKVITNNVGNMNQQLTNTPAGKIQQLKNNFGDLKEQLGNGLLIVLTPIVSWLNRIVLSARNAVNAIGTVIKQVAKLTGIKLPSLTGTITGSDDTSSSLDDASDSTANLADNTSDANTNLSNANKNAKKLQRTLMGFDQINKLSEVTDTDTGSTGSSGSGTTDTGTTDTGSSGTSALDAIGDSVDKISPKLKDLVARAKELGNLFKKGFQIGFGNSLQNIDNIKKQLSSIGKSLSEIFTDSRVTTALGNLVNSISTTLGEIYGSITSIGISIIDWITGGIASSLADNKENIIRWISDIANNFTRISDTIGNFAVALATIFQALDTSDAKAVLGDLITTVTNVVGGVWDLLTSIAADIVDLFLQPIINNADLIKTTLSGMFTTVKPIFDGIKNVVTTIVTTVVTLYQQHISPIIQAITQTISDVLTILLNGYNTYLKPVFDYIAQQVGQILSEQVVPIIKDVGEILGQIFDTIKNLWTSILSPLIEMIASMIMPVLSVLATILGGVLLTGIRAVVTAIKLVVSVAKLITGIITAIVNAIADTLGPILQDASEKVTSCKNVFTTMFNGIKAIVTQVMNAVSSIISKVMDAVKTVVDTVLDAIGGFFTSAFEGIKNTVDTVIGAVGDFISTTMGGIETVVDTILGTIKGIFETCFGGIQTVVSTAMDLVKTYIVDPIQSAYDTVSGILNDIDSAFHDIFDPLYNYVYGVIENVKSVFNFSWHLPHLELPSITWEGSFSLDPISVPTFHLNWYAKGGIVDQATLFGNSVIGEAGKEAIIPLERNTGWMDNVASRIASQIGTSDQPINITIQTTLDGRIVAQNTINYVNDTAKRTGVNPLSAYI